MKPHQKSIAIEMVVIFSLLVSGSLPASSMANEQESSEGSATASVPCTLGTWSTAATGPIERLRAGSATDGRYLYVFGGQNYQTPGMTIEQEDTPNSIDAITSPQAMVLGDLWRYDPTANTWLQMADMPIAKANIQGAYWDGKIYVPGGYRLTSPTFLDELAIYTIATNSWTTGAPLPAGTQGVATAAYYGKIYVAGGSTGTISYLDTLLIYNITSNTWSTGAPLPAGNRYGRMVTVGNYIYYAGGDEPSANPANSLYRYDPEANAWSIMRPMQTGRSSPELMSDGTHIFIVNGADASRFDGVPANQTVEIYDIARNSWSYGSPTTQTSAGPSGGRVGDRLVIMGGSNGGAAINTVQTVQIDAACYKHCDASTWSTSTTGPAARMRAGAATDGRYLYIFGGQTSPTLAPSLDGQNDTENSIDAIDIPGAANAADTWRYDPEGNSWTRLADMPTGKSNIQGAYWDGNLYVPGGYLSATTPNLNEMAIYSIAANSWSTGAPMAAALSGTASAALAGKIYVAGGVSSTGYVNTLAIYDVASNTWSTGAALPAAIGYGRMVAAGNYLYFAAGISTSNAAMDTLYRYDPAANAWTILAHMQTGRNAPEVMSDGAHIYVVNGGSNSVWSGVPSAKTVEIYDIAANMWSYGSPTSQTSAAPSGGRVGNRLVIMGGITGGVYFNLVQTARIDQACFTACDTVTWNSGASDPSARYRAGSASNGSYVYIFGGWQSGGTAVNNDLWRYNPATNAWTRLADMPTGKANIQGAYWQGKIYVPGGYKVGSVYLNELAIYDIASNTWSTGAPLAAATSGAALAALAGKVYVAGGSDSGGEVNTLAIYDIASNTWSSGAPTPAASAYGRLITVGSLIYFASGHPAAISNAFYRYDPQLDTWATLPPMQTARIGGELASDGEHIFVFNGANSTYWSGVPAAQTVEIYDLATNRWSYGNPTMTNTAAQTGAQVGNKIVLVGGTISSIYTATNTVQIGSLDKQACFKSNCVLDGWKDYTPEPSASYRAGAASDGQYLYIFGGQYTPTAPGSPGASAEINSADGINAPEAYRGTTWRYNPLTNVWTTLADMPTAKGNIQGAYWNGKIYVPGGYNGGFLAELAIYDIASNTWSTGAPLLAARSGGATAAYNGKIYSAGGNPGPVNEVQIYTIASNTWSNGAPLPVSISYGRMITVGSYIYNVGGIASGSLSNQVFRYDPNANSWVTLAPMHTARSSPEVMSDGKQIFVVAGADSSIWNGLPILQTVEIYDIASNTWRFGPPTLFTAAAPAGGRVGNQLVIAGGVDLNTDINAVNIIRIEALYCTSMFLPCIMR